MPFEPDLPGSATRPSAALRACPRLRMRGMRIKL